MKCPACEGTGIIHFRNIHEICGKCKGIGFIDEKPKPKKQKTEQEWLQTASTEQLADKLTDFSFWLVPIIPTEDKREQIRKKIELWLKEKHDEM